MITGTFQLIFSSSKNILRKSATQCSLFVLINNIAESSFCNLDKSLEENSLVKMFIKFIVPFFPL